MNREEAIKQAAALLRSPVAPDRNVECYLANILDPPTEPLKCWAWYTAEGSLYGVTADEPGYNLEEPARLEGAVIRHMVEIEA